MRCITLLLAIVLAGCAAAGPAVLGSGRGNYNDVINRTEDEQVLSMIVRHRYDETFGLLAVASVTANVRFGASAGANAGIGPAGDYAGNLVPLSVGATWEENPTISYVPLRGEQFIERMLAPIAPEEALSLGRMNVEGTDTLGLLLRRINGISNPLYAPTAPAAAFDRFTELYTSLRDGGVVDVVRLDGGGYALLCHDYAPAWTAALTELLAALGIEQRPEGRADLVIPLEFFVGSANHDRIDLETPSALEVIEAAGLGVDVPAGHLALGIARETAKVGAVRFVAIRSSATRPPAAMVAIEHRRWWFYVDARDAHSKQGFLLLRTLVGLRLDDKTVRQSAPMLTVPVGR